MLLRGNPRMAPTIWGMAHPKITKALAKKLAGAKGGPVCAVVFTAIDSDKLTLSSFAARAKQRNEVVKDRLSAVMTRVQAWEAQNGQTVPVAFRPDDAAVVVTGTEALLEHLAGDEAVAALDVEAA